MAFLFVKAIFVLSLTLFVYGSDCHHQIACKVCIANGCKFYVTDTSGFCGNLDVNPKLYLFRISRISSCTSTSTKPMTEKVLLPILSNGKDFPGSGNISSHPSPAHLPSRKNVTNFLPIASPLSSHTDEERKGKKTRKPIDSISMVSLMCKQYIGIFENIHPKRDAKEEERKCLKKLSI